MNVRYPAILRAGEIEQRQDAFTTRVLSCSGDFLCRVCTSSYTRENKQRQRQMHLKITLLARVRLLYSGLIEG